MKCDNFTSYIASLAVTCGNEVTTEIIIYQYRGVIWRTFTLLPKAVQPPRYLIAFQTVSAPGLNLNFCRRFKKL
jgi:hypothetical protein